MLISFVREERHFVRYQAEVPDTLNFKDSEIVREICENHTRPENIVGSDFESNHLIARSVRRVNPIAPQPTQYLRE